MYILRKYIRSILSEGMPQRQAFAQGLRDRDITTSQAVSQPRGREEQDIAYRKMIGLGRPIKQLFAQYADRTFLDSLVTVHWAEVKDAIHIMKSGSSRDELSAIAYLPGERLTGLDAGGITQQQEWRVGIVIKGHITLLANDMSDVHSGAGVAYREVDPERTRMSGANKGVARSHHPDTYTEGDSMLVFDMDDWNPALSRFGKPRNEALVDNWQIIGLIVPPEKKAAFEAGVEQLGLNATVTVNEGAL